MPRDNHRSDLATAGVIAMPGDPSGSQPPN